MKEQEPGQGQEEEQCQILLKTKAQLWKAAENEFGLKSGQVLQLHNHKLTKIQQKLGILPNFDQAQENPQEQKIHEDTNALKDERHELGQQRTEFLKPEETDALKRKRDELEQQRREFLKARDNFRLKLISSLNKDINFEEVEDLKKRFTVECYRLEKALPVYARRQDIIELVKKNPVSILMAETESGKSTQVVQYLLDAGLADHGTIVCTQPRKEAAVSLATHVAQELASNVGREVGYKTGTRVKTSSSTKVVYMTDHDLLNECLTDPYLKAFSCVVVDEAHERSLFTDLLLSMVKRCVGKRPELRVIITATIDPQVFVEFFDDCPILKVSGRAFPVEVIWQDSASEKNDSEKYVKTAVDKAVDIHVREPPGDILVFLASAVEIQKSCEMFQQKMKDRTDFKCFQLHGQLQADEQQKVFEPLDSNKRKIVFATNYAETSITIDGIKYVVDTGVAKEMRYDPKRNIRSLEVTVISQSSAEQRKGRAGRTAPGKCYRLYSESSFQSMDTISLPEILKTHLGHAVLKLAELGVTPDLYDFVQSPSQEAISAALTTLRQLGALYNGIITDTGRWLAKLPFDPKVGLMTFLGRNAGLLYDTIALAALVSVGSSLFYRGPTDEDHKNLAKAKLKFSHPGGDSLTSLQVYRAWETVDEEQKNTWCLSHCVNAKLIHYVRDTVSEVCEILNDKNVQTYQLSESKDTDDELRNILFQCNVSNLCLYLGRQSAGYFAAHASRNVYVHPSSVMSSQSPVISSQVSSPKWVVYDQLLHKSRHFITGITPVDDEWVKQLSNKRCGFDVNEVRRMKLENIFTQPAGSRAFTAMIGPQYKNLRQLEERYGVQEGKVVVIEASKESGEIKVFSTEPADSMIKVTEELIREAQRAIQNVQQEVQEVSIRDEKSGLRVILGQNASITDILMPHQKKKNLHSQDSRRCH